MFQEYFAAKLAADFCLAVSLADLVSVSQFEHRDICLVPGVAAYWYGVVNFEGSLLWVLDSDRFFNLAALHEPRSNKLTAVVINHRETRRRVAVVVRLLYGLIAIETERLQPLPNQISTLLKNSCMGAVEHEQRDFYLLNSLGFLQQLSQHGESAL